MPVRVISAIVMCLASFVLAFLVANCLSCFITGNAFGFIVFTTGMFLAIPMFASIASHLENSWH